MPIIYRTGNVVEAFKAGELDILVHGVNCQGKMNSGIAKEIRAEFPETFEGYTNYITSFIRGMANRDDMDDLLGHINPIKINNKFKYIVNAFTQYNYGYEKDHKYCSYDAIETAMKAINKEATGNVKIGMPKIGAGLGGGDWKVIEAIINSVFQDREVFVYEIE